MEGDVGSDEHLEIGLGFRDGPSFITFANITQDDVYNAYNEKKLPSVFQDGGSLVDLDIPEVQIHHTKSETFHLPCIFDEPDEIDEIGERHGIMCVNINTPGNSFRNICSSPEWNRESNDDSDYDSNDDSDEQFVPRFVNRVQSTIEVANAATQTETFTEDDGDGDLMVLPVEAKPDTRDVQALRKKEYDRNGLCKLPYGGTSDSGASDTVGPLELFEDYPLEASPASKADMWYVGAGGQRIKSMGQRTVLMRTNESKLMWLTVQVAAVKKLLNSVSKHNDGDNEVVRYCI